MHLICDNCLKDTGVSVGTSRGGAAAALSNAGGVAKCDVLFASSVGKTSTWLYYCSEACKDAHYPQHLATLQVPPDVLEKLDANLAELQAGIPAASKEIGEKLESLRKRLMGF